VFAGFGILSASNLQRKLLKISQSIKNIPWCLLVGLCWRLSLNFSWKLDELVHLIFVICRQSAVVWSVLVRTLDSTFKSFVKLASFGTDWDLILRSGSSLESIIGPSTLVVKDFWMLCLVPAEGRVLWLERFWSSVVVSSVLRALDRFKGNLNLSGSRLFRKGILFKLGLFRIKLETLEISFHSGQETYEIW